MAQGQLWFRHPVFHALMVVIFGMLLISCRADEKPIGMSLLFQSAGMSVGVDRFDPDGFRGPVPGAVGGMYPRGGAIMSFMPGDSKRGMPKFVVVEWTVNDPATDEWWKENISNRTDKYSPKWEQDYKKAMSQVPKYIKRIDLTSIITPELIAQVRADYQNTQLKVIITFNNEDVSIQAMAYKWR